MKLARAAFAFLAISAASVAQIPGTFESFGEGCPDGSLLYEQFAPGTFDLGGGLSLDWIPNGGQGYTVTRGIATFLPFAGGLIVGLGDDALSGPIALGFSFPYPTGLRSTTQIDICSNGYVYLEPGTITSTRCCDGSGNVLRAFRNDTPSWALLGTDLDPGRGGTVWFNTAPGVAWVTWDQIQEDGQPGLNTCQIQFWASGQVSMIWTSVAVQAHNTIVGWSGGHGVDDDGSFDFSVHPIHDMGASSGPLTISAPLASLPTIGRTFVVDIGNVPSNALAGALLLATSTANVDLGGIGMTGCRLYVGSELPSFPVVLNPPTGSVTMPIPNLASLAGFVMHAQQAVFAPNVTTLGVATSNRRTLRIGNVDPVVVRASGAENLNDDLQNPFWTIVNATPFDIVSVRLDWALSPVSNSIFFDTNQIGLGDRFDGGNSTTALCKGTYRNGCDVLTGLDYAASGATPCGATSRTGWIGLIYGAAAGDFRAIEFRFTQFNPGEVFQFDAETDGGPGGRGGDMAGLLITVRLSNGTTRSGVLTAIDALTSTVSL